MSVLTVCGPNEKHVSSKDYKVASSLSFAYQYFVMEDSFRLHQVSNTTSRSMFKNNFNHQNHSRLLSYEKKTQEMNTQNPCLRQT